jgi:hypothetical protein
VEELDKLRELGAKIVYVNNPKVEKLRSEGIAAGDPLWSDFSEKFAGAMRLNADYTIENDGDSLDALHSEVHKAMIDLFGDWLEWQELTKMDGGFRI